AVTRERVRDLMGEDDGEPARVLREREETGVDGDLPAREREGVLLLRVIDDDEAPAVIGAVRHAGDALPDLLNRAVDGRRRVDPALSQHLVEGARAELVLLLRGDENQLRAARKRRPAAC